MAKKLEKCAASSCSYAADFRPQYEGYCCAGCKRADNGQPPKIGMDDRDGHSILCERMRK